MLAAGEDRHVLIFSFIDLFLLTWVWSVVSSILDVEQALRSTPPLFTGGPV